ncbi:MAG: hypothetical protein VW516_10710, partial [Rhodospirillaceae bacterium]
MNKTAKNYKAKSLKGVGTQYPTEPEIQREEGFSLQDLKITLSEENQQLKKTIVRMRDELEKISQDYEEIYQRSMVVDTKEVQELKKTILKQREEIDKKYHNNYREKQNIIQN